MFETFLIYIFGETLYTTLLNTNPELLCVFIIIFVFMLLMLIFSLIKSVVTFGGSI